MSRQALGLIEAAVATLWHKPVAPPKPNTGTVEGAGLLKGCQARLLAEGHAMRQSQPGMCPNPSECVMPVYVHTPLILQVAELTPVFEPHCAADTGLSGTTTVNSSTGQAAAAAGRRVQHWVVQLASGRQLLAKRVLVGIGSTNMPRVPPAFRGLQAVQDLNLDTQAPGKVTMLNNNNSSSSTGAPSGSASSSNRSNSTIDMNAARTCLPSSSSGDTTGDSSNSISNSNNSNGSIPGSDCCSGGCCDGACSNSSGWSDDSSATATTAAAGPQGARITTAASGGKAFGPAGNAGAAATAFSDGSTASSPRSTTGSGSLCSWLDLAGEQELSQLDKAAGGLCDTNQPQPLAAQADAISTADWPAACADAAPPLKTATGNSLAPGLVSAGEWDTTDDGSSSTGSSMVTFQEAASMQLEPDHSCDSTAAAATAAATAAGSSGVSAKRPAVELLLPSPGPCNWVSVSSSPTGSACDSLCSWLGCEHSLAKQLAADQQQQQVQQVRCETVAESTALLMSRLTLDASCSLQHHLQGEGQFSLSADGFLLGAAAAAADEAQMQLQPIRTDCSALAAAGAGAAAAAGTAIAATASGREERGAASPAGCGSSTNDAAVPLLNAASGTAAAATASHPSAQQTGGPSLAAVAAKGAAGAAAGPEQLSVLLGGPLDSGTFYPRGRLMHSWQLVEALQSAAGAAGGQQQQQQEAETPVAACPAASSSSSSARLSDPLHSSSSSTTDVRARGKARTARRQHSKSKSRSRSSTSKQQQGGAAASSSKYAVSAVATLLQQKGLAAPGESVLIMGGGLTTAHLAVLAAAAVGGEAPSNTSIPGMIGSASSKQDDGSTATSDSDSDSGSGSSGLVRLLLRGPSVRVKQFDVDLEWMGRNRGATLQFGFRQALSDMGDRLRLMRRVLQVGLVLSTKPNPLCCEIDGAQPIDLGINTFRGVGLGCS